MCDALHYLFSNIFINFGSNLYTQIVSIPMVNSFEPLNAVLFLLCYVLETVIVLCFVVRYFMSILVLQSS